MLAGRCLHEGQARVDNDIHLTVIESLLETISQPEVALRVRIAAGEVLGYLGDTRLGDLVTVDAGEFWMGDEEGEDFEKPQHKVFLPTYWHSGRHWKKPPLLQLEHMAMIWLVIILLQVILENLNLKTLF